MAQPDLLINVLEAAHPPLLQRLGHLLNVVPLRAGERQRHARTAWSARPAEAVRVSEADPRRLGVNAAISMPGVLDEVPPEYVPRDVDALESGVRARAAAAAERGGFVLLVGGVLGRKDPERLTALWPWRGRARTGGRPGAISCQGRRWRAGRSRGGHLGRLPVAWRRGWGAPGWP
jgi:hypothetical protein